MRRIGFGEDAPMSTERLRFEFEGINEFSAFGFTTLDPYIYDPEENYLVTQFLNDYEPFITSLQNGEVDEEVAEACGAVMGTLPLDIFLPILMWISFYFLITDS